jgi:hypothetical protein
MEGLAGPSSTETDLRCRWLPAFSEVKVTTAPEAGECVLLSEDDPCKWVLFKVPEKTTLSDGVKGRPNVTCLDG